MGFNLGSPQDDDIMAEINMTPLVDIMLVLLVIFMATSSIAFNSGFNIDLPEATRTSGSTKDPSAVIVTLLKDGRSAVQGKEVPFHGLKDAIAKALAEEKTTLVVLEGDQTSRLGRAVAVMDLAGEAGAKKFAIATDNADTDDSN